jgi:hypothetical protein
VAVASIRLLAPWEAPDTPALGRTKREKKWARTGTEVRLCWQRTVGRMEKWIGIRMTHQRRIKKATNKKNKDVKKKKRRKGGE